jgi:hypothetical protein
LGIIIIIVVFNAGIKIGELKASVRGNDFGWGRQGYDGRMMYGQPRMMIVEDSALPFRGEAIKVSTTTAKKK